MKPSSSTEHPLQNYSSFQIGETSSAKVKIGPSADGGLEDHRKAGRSNPGNSFDHNSNIEIESHPLLTTKNSSVLYLAALTGDWKKASTYFSDRNEARTNSSLRRTARNETALHVAASAEQTNFVEELVKVMTTEELEVKTEYGYTALCFAAISGNLKMGEILVDKNPSLLLLRGNNGSFPLYLAVTHERKDMADFLYAKTDLKEFEISAIVDLLHATILSDYFDIGWEILHKNPDLALERNNSGETALHDLARKAYKIGTVNQLTIWELMIVYRNKISMKEFAHQMVESLWKTVTKKIDDDQIFGFINTPTNFLYEAAKVGNVEFLVILIREYANLISNLDYNFINVFYEAVENRQERVFELIYELGLSNMFGELGGERNTKLMHLAVQIAAPKHLKRVSNPALQMTRELQWYEEAKKIARVSEEAWRERFNKEHKQLREEGEEWLKRVSSSCMLVAALIGGAVYAATFNIKNNNNNNYYSVAFLFADFLALTTSTSSILTFLSILTSRFEEEDFLSLPWPLLMGFANLIFSMLMLGLSNVFFPIVIKFDWNPKDWIATLTNIGSYIIILWLIFSSSLWSDIVRATVLCKFPLERHRCYRQPLMQL